MTTRRDFLAANLIGAAGLAANPTRMFSESDGVASVPATPNPARTDRNFWVDWPGYLTAEMNQARNRRLAALASIRTKDQLQERITMVRSKLWELIGGMPEKTPLNPRVKGTLDRGSYRIENIHFESFPKVYVTANLYLPAAGKPPYPAILAPVGHSDNGKAYHYYQHLYQNLARQGYVVLSYDPFGQGERLQYINPKTGRSLYGPTGEHSQAGRPMVLMGESFALYCAWDGIRGLDYLISRPEVDATRLGCTGQSGGGTMTMYLAALEPRLRVAAVSDGNTENVAGPFFDPPGATDDAEQNIVGSLPLGIDRGDMLLAFAPKPLLICYTTHDEGVTYSPVYEEATQEIYRELQRVYGLLGAKDQVGLFASHLPHGLNYLQSNPDLCVVQSLVPESDCGNWRSGTGSVPRRTAQRYQHRSGIDIDWRTLRRSVEYRSCSNCFCFKPLCKRFHESDERTCSGQEGAHRIARIAAAKNTVAFQNSFDQSAQDRGD